MGKRKNALRAAPHPALRATFPQVKAGRCGVHGGSGLPHPVTSVTGFAMTGVDYFFFFLSMLAEASTSMKPSPATSAAWAMKTKAPGSMPFTRAFTL